MNQFQKKDMAQANQSKGGNFMQNKRFEIYDLKVRSVTKDNFLSDGGRNRQEILAELPDEIDVLLVKCMENTNFYPRRMKVVEKKTKQVLGYLPFERVDEFWNTKEMKGYVNFYIRYYCGLKPTKKDNSFYGNSKNSSYNFQASF